MPDKYTTLHPENEPTTNIYPNIKPQNIENGSIQVAKLSQELQQILTQLNYNYVNVSSLAQIKSSLANFGLNMNYQYDATFQRYNFTFEQIISRVTCNFVNYDLDLTYSYHYKIGTMHHMYLFFTPNEQIPNSIVFAILTSAHRPPRNVFVPCIVYNNLAIATINSDGTIRVNRQIEDGEPIEISLSWEE